MNLARKIFSFAQFILVIFVLAFSVRAAGEVDPTFSPQLVDVDYLSYTNSEWRTSVRRVAVQPDGKILAVGIFTVVNNSLRDSIVRFNADGTLDTTFKPPALVRFSGNPYLEIAGLALQSDGKILIGGNFVTFGAVRRTYLARLNSDGSLDSTFNANQTGQSVGGTVIDIDISADGKIVISGDIGAGTQRDVVRLLSDGTLDTSFNPQIPQASDPRGLDVLVQPDGKVLISVDNFSGSEEMMFRLNVDGSVDFSHSFSGNSRNVNRMVVQPDGKILLGGAFNTIDGFPIQQGLARLNANGSYDTTFNAGNSGPGGGVGDIELLANGKIFISGGFGSYNNVSRQYFALLNSDGTLDNSFNYTGTTLRPGDMAIQPDGKIVVGTYVEFTNDGLSPPLGRLNADATVDSSIQPFMGSVGAVYKVLVQPDGKILLGGFYNHINLVFQRNLERFLPDGTTDPSFTNSVFFDDVLDYISELDLQPDGKILVAGNITDPERIFPDGSHDVTVHSSPGAAHLYDLPNGKLIGFTDRVVRFSAAGFLETEPTRFDFNGSAQKAAILPDGKVIAVGTFTQVNFTTNRGRIARLNADLTFDATWDTPGGGANSQITDIALQPDGKLIVGGFFTSFNGNSNYKYLARLNPDGTLDLSFNPVLNAPVTTLKLQPDGRILFSGTFSLVNGVSRNNMARVLSNGALDNSFNIGSGADGSIRSIDLQSDGKILIGGEFRRVNGVERFGVARLLNTASPQQKLFDYDGDGRADVSVFRPSTNRWYEFLSSFGTVAEQTFGISGDLITPADYDGDGKTDIGIFRASSGDWWYLSSLDGGQKSVHWGQSGDIPRPSDFDGDGKADFVLFRPSNNVWYRFGSTGATSITAFGLAGDKPVSGDFDGDGKSDLAIFRPSDGNWWWQSSIDNIQRATRWGISTDIPAPADFDGDGKTDMAVYRASTGTWYIINSTNGSFTIMNFGISEDKPVPADYDGDGRADIAVFRPSTGIWYQMLSTQGFTAQQLGISSDVPTPNAFVP